MQDMEHGRNHPVSASLICRRQTRLDHAVGLEQCPLPMPSSACQHAALQLAHTPLIFRSLHQPPLTVVTHIYLFLAELRGFSKVLFPPDCSPRLLLRRAHPGLRMQ